MWATGKVHRSIRRCGTALYAGTERTTGLYAFAVMDAGIHRYLPFAGHRTAAALAGGYLGPCKCYSGPAGRRSLALIAYHEPRGTGTACHAAAVAYGGAHPPEGTRG